MRRGILPAPSLQSIDLEHGGCPLREEVVLQLLSEGRLRYPKAFIIDIPDNLSLKDTQLFTSICQRMLDTGRPVIIFATPGHWARLRRLGTFARFHIERFDRPTAEQLCEVFTGRIDQVSEGGVKPPLTEEAARQIAPRSRTIREFLQTISLVLAKMKTQ